LEHSYNLQEKSVGIGFYIDCKVDVSTATLALNCIKPNGATCHFTCTETQTNFAYFITDTTSDLNVTGTWEAQVKKTEAGKIVFGKKFKFVVNPNLGGF